MLVLENLRKTFNPGTPNDVQALNGVNLTVDDGSFVVIIGTNGSGKSTLLNAIAGAFSLDEGRIELFGHDITRWPEYRRATLIGRVFQNPFSGTAPHMSIAENLALATRRGIARGLGRVLPRELRERLKEQVTGLHMDLETRMDNEIGTLSGGQRQALTLLMATQVRPALLLLDEHTAALDPKTADQVIRLTQEIVSRDRLTTLMVTHSMHQAINLGDRIIMMHKGEITHAISSSQKKHLRVEDLLEQFDEIQRSEQLTPAVAEMLRVRFV